MCLDIAKGKAAVADTRSILEHILDIHSWPRRADIVVAERAEIFQRIIKNERVELINQNVVEVLEYLVKERRHHQMVVSLDALEELRRKMRNHVAFREV